MQIFNGGLFWFVEGVLFVIVLLGLRAWAEGQGIRMTWWRWAVAIGWLLVAGFTIAFVGTSFGEGEAVAATRGGALFGAITVISGVGTWRLLRAGAS